jgi:regulatory protein
MERRLLAARFESGEVEDVLTRLERVGLIDDVAFARQYAEHRFGARKEGSRGVEQGLRAAGIAPALAITAAEGAPDDDEDRAADLARSRATRLMGIAPEKAFARLSSLLMRRGYSPEIARSAARKALEIAFQDE